MKKKWTALLCIVFSLMLAVTGVGYASLSSTLLAHAQTSLDAPNGVFISNVVIQGHTDADLSASTVNRYFGTNLDSTVTLSPDNGSSTLTFRVTFYNNSTEARCFNEVTYLEGEGGYDNAAITFLVDGFTQTNLIALPMIGAKDYLTCQLTFSFADAGNTAANVLHSVLHFSFDNILKPLLSVEGNSADNINTIHDGSLNYNGSDTRYRWTSWSADDNDRGKPVSMTMAWANEATFDQIDIYHFIDHYGCDFPESMTLYAYDDTIGDYVLLEDYTTSTNFTNARRNAQGLYTMTINNRTATFTHNYSGAAPCTTFTFDEPITTRGFKIVFQAKSGYFVGLLEIVVTNDGVNVQ